MNLTPKLFIGCHATGFTYCDMRRTRNGDYLVVARIPYSTLTPEWVPGVTVTPEMRRMIEEDMATIQAMRGQTYKTSVCGSEVVLGGKS